MKTDSILEQVRERLERDAIQYQEAAAEIGVTAQSLQRHLNGEYVRSDSIAKYRLWLDGRTVRARSSVPNGAGTRSVKRTVAHSGATVAALWERTQVPSAPYRVVDIFSGCGGLSFGFERFAGGQVFNTTLALDLEEPMIRVFNDNHPSPGGEVPIGRQVDVTDFLNETEIQAFYLDHLARSGQDSALHDELRDLAGYDLNIVRANLHFLDNLFLRKVAELRSDDRFVHAFRKAAADALGQTSVVAFHRALKLPVTGLGVPRLGTLLWSEEGTAASVLDRLTIVPDKDVISTQRRAGKRTWDSELRKLAAKSAGSGTGQLSSSAKRISRFLDFLGAAGTPIYAAWLEWRAMRDAVRITVFDNTTVKERVQAIYRDGRQVEVLLGGPPCQGFSRIGRGKIRSLREQSVHVHEDNNLVDSRNQLLEHYVLFVSALAPRIFLFENVRGFQAVVGSGRKRFDAAAALAEAIEDVSSKGLKYSVDNRIVVASEHFVPQVRERYLMVGVRDDVDDAIDVDSPEWCLALPESPPVPLEVALEGLPEPSAAGESDDEKDSGYIEVADLGGQLDCSASAVVFRQWISSGSGGKTDSHIARRPRADDAAFFDLMGPGKRWMDYRCDDSPTLQRLKQTVIVIRKALKESPSLSRKLDLSEDALRDLEKLLDGSLSLRLLLESIAPMPGELQHHLLAENYLQKKEGNHGDWLARMDASKPSKTMVSHMAKDTYAYVHPTRPRTLSVREAARIQTFPDSYRFSSVGLVDGFRIVGNAVPPLLSAQFAERVAQILWAAEHSNEAQKAPGATSMPRVQLSMTGV